MSSSFEKSVKGATKIKAAPPKTKYIEHILVATHAGEAGVAEVFRALQHRLRDSTWTVVFKSLITVHLMIREGSPDVTLSYLSKHRNILGVSMFSDVQTQGRNIRHYADYLTERGRAFRETKRDWVRMKESRLEKLSVDKGLLRETEVVQHQLTALLKCDVMDGEPDTEITITVFRLLVLDLLALFQALNQAMISILGHFFEMSKPDAERAMEVYRTFTKQTDFVVQYLSVARQHEHHTRVEVPKLKHAPVNLGRQLEEYLRDPDFEIHRRQYLAELEVKKSGKGGSSSSALRSFKSDTTAKPASNNPFPSVNGSQSSSMATKPSRGPDVNLIDFFESIEQNQTPMATQPNPGAFAAGQQPWGTNVPFQAQPVVSEMQFNGFTQAASLPQQPQQQQAAFQSPNPFLQQQQQQQQQMQQQQQQQPMGPFSGQSQQIQQQPMPPAFTGAGFGGFTPQPQPSFQPSALGSIPQDSVASFQSGPSPFQSVQATGQQGSNPFRQSQMMTGVSPMNMGSGVAQSSVQIPAVSASFSPVASPLNRQNTNPFARSSPQAPQPFGASSNSSPFQSPSPQQQGGPTAAPLQAMATGTNPFAKNLASPQPPQQQQQRPATSSAIMPQATGTNPFRQGAFVNHDTGFGWQHNQQRIGGGLDDFQTVPAFPRPAQQSPWQS